VIELTTALALTGFTELSGLAGQPAQTALATATQPDSGQWTTLRRQLEPLVADAARQHVTIGITARNLAAPHEKQSLDVGSMGPFKAASTIKLGLASMITKGIDEGKWTLDKVTVTPEAIVGGFDPISHFTQSLGLPDAGFHFGRKIILPHPPNRRTGSRQPRTRTCW
jgi:beta-lactamase class A